MPFTPGPIGPQGAPPLGARPAPLANPNLAALEALKKKKKGPPKPPASLQGLQMAVGGKPSLG